MSEIKGEEREKSLCLKDYLSDGYFSNRQWESYLFQVKAVKKLINKGTVLEIGAGGGIINAVLKAIGFHAETLDINKNLKPDYIASLSDAEYEPPKIFDCVLCAEVLEHIPFEKLHVCLQNICKTTRQYAVITLPNCLSAKYKFGIRINRHYKEAAFGLRKNNIAPMHFWELNSTACCTNKKMTKYLNQYFKIIEENMIMKNPYHYYYILEKKHG